MLPFVYPVQLAARKNHTESTRGQEYLENLTEKVDSVGVEEKHSLKTRTEQANKQANTRHADSPQVKTRGIGFLI
jgi:hypothetical protein